MKWTKTLGKVIGAMVVVLGCVLVGMLAGGWLLMLFIGVVHGEWLPNMPTIGYWSAVKVSAMLSLMVGIAVSVMRGSD
jgi:hypothetical protein